MYLVFSTTLSNSRAVLLKYAFIIHEQQTKLDQTVAIKMDERRWEPNVEKEDEKIKSVAPKRQTPCLLLGGAHLLLEREVYKNRPPVAKLHANANKSRFWQFYCMMVDVIVRFSYMLPITRLKIEAVCTQKEESIFLYLCTSFWSMNLELLGKLPPWKIYRKINALLQQNNQTKQYIKWKELNKAET